MSSTTRPDPLSLFHEIQNLNKCCRFQYRRSFNSKLFSGWYSRLLIEHPNKIIKVAGLGAHAIKEVRVVQVVTQSLLGPIENEKTPSGDDVSSLVAPRGVEPLLTA